MAFFDFGVSQGLSVKIPYGDMMERDLQIKAMERQTRIDAENKAKLLGDDLKMASVSSDYNRKRLNEFYQKKFTEIGDFVNNNPDLQMNPVAMMRFHAMKHELLDNDIVAEDMRFQTNYQNFTKWISENPGAADYDPEVQKMLSQVENYKATGNADPNSKTKKEFMFVNPDMKVNVPEELRAHFGKVEALGMQWIGGNKENGYETFVTDEDRVKAAQSLIGDGRSPMSRVLQKQWDGLSNDAKATYGNDIARYVADMGKPFVSPGKKEPATNYNPNMTAAQARAAAAQQAIDNPILSRMKEAADPNNLGKTVGIPQDIMNSVYLDKKGYGNLADGTIVSSRGAEFNKALTPTQRTILQSVKAQNTGEIQFEPNAAGGGQYKTRFKVMMLPGQFEQFWGSTQPLDADFWSSGFGGVSEDGSDEFTIHGKHELWNPEGDYTDIMKPEWIPDENGQGGKYYVTMYIDKPVSTSDTMLFAKGNQALGAKAVDMDYSATNQQAMYDNEQPYTEGTKMEPGMIVRYSDGKVYQVTEVDKNGNATKHKLIQ